MKLFVPLIALAAVAGAAIFAPSFFPTAPAATPVANAQRAIQTAGETPSNPAAQRLFTEEEVMAELQVYADVFGIKVQVLTEKEDIARFTAAMNTVPPAGPTEDTVQKIIFINATKQAGVAMVAYVINGAVDVDNTYTVGADVMDKALVDQDAKSKL